jgi:hypothetical protein
MPSGPFSLRFARISAMRFRPASETGILPLGGSVIQDERASPFTRPTCAPRSSQNWL